MYKLPSVNPVFCPELLGYLYVGIFVIDYFSILKNNIFQVDEDVERYARMSSDTIACHIPS
jgi:hypothetical protein